MFIPTATGAQYTFLCTIAATVKRRDLERSLADLGWTFSARKTTRRVTDSDREEAIPRHVEINEILARAILRRGWLETKMRFEGKLRKSGKCWLAEIPILDAITQGRTRKEALAMVCDWIETMIDQRSFTATIDRTVGDSFEIGGSDAAALVALLLRRRRQAAGVSLADIAARLGSTSRNAYARYERGDAVPSIGKLDELLKATSSSGDFVIREASPPYSSTTRKKK